MDDLTDGYDFDLGGSDFLVIRFKPRFKQKPSYCITLISEINGKWYQVVRADDWDGRPHLDRSYPDGRVEKQWRTDIGDNQSNYQEALDWLLDHWDVERQRYESELNQR